MKRNSNDRLGSNGASEVKNHAYFKETDWDKLYAKKINPPFIPTKVSNTVILTHYESQFSKRDREETGPILLDAIIFLQNVNKRKQGRNPPVDICIYHLNLLV